MQFNLYIYILIKINIQLKNTLLLTYILYKFDGFHFCAFILFARSFNVSNT